MIPARFGAKASRRWRWFVFSAMVIALLGLAMLLWPDRGTSREAALTFRKEDGTREQRSVGRALEEAAGARPETNAVVTAEMENAITASLRETEAAFRSIERITAKQIGAMKGERQGESFAVEYILIPQPTDEEYARYSALMTAALDRLPKQARRAGYDRHVKLLNDFTLFEQPFKVVSRIVGERRDKDGSGGSSDVRLNEAINTGPRVGIHLLVTDRHESFMEHFVPTRESVKIEGNKATFENGSSRGLLGEKQERYRYLFADGALTGTPAEAR